MGRIKNVRKFTVRFAGQKQKRVAFGSVKAAIAGIVHSPSLLITEDKPRRIRFWIRGNGLRIDGTVAGLRQVRRHLVGLGITAASLAKTQEATAC